MGEDNRWGRIQQDERCDGFPRVSDFFTLDGASGIFGPIFFIRIIFSK